MKTLGEATDFLLQSNDPSDDLLMVETLMDNVRQRGTEYEISRTYLHLVPFVEAYTYNMVGWLKFVRSVRDDIASIYGRGSAKYMGMQKFFRTLEVRYVQQMRRERLRQAVAWLEVEHPGLTTEQKKLWCKRLEQLWMKQRRAWLAAHRKQHGKRLNLDEQREVLDAFWADVDDNIKQGNLPRYE